MSRRVLAVAFFVVVVCLVGLPRAATAQCTNGPVRGPAVKLYSTLPCYAVSVTPDGSTTPQRVVNTSGYTASFTVKNTGYNSDTFSFTCSGSGGVTCTARTPTSKTLLAGATTTVTATYATGSVTGTGTLTLTATGASGQSADNGYYNVPIGSYGVAVTPDGATAANRTANTSGYSETFTVTNSGTIQNTYTLSCTGANGATCGTPSPTSLTLTGGAAGTVSMPYSVGAIGTGTLTLTASGTSGADNGSFSVSIVAAAVAVTPDGSTTAPRPANSSGGSARRTTDPIRDLYAPGDAELKALTSSYQNWAAWWNSFTPTRSSRPCARMSSIGSKIAPTP